MLSSFSVRKPYTVVVAVVVVILLGIISFTRMTTDLLPSVDLPYVIIMTSYTGASPEEVELTVTKPLEQALATTSNIENITSVSRENSSVLILEFSQDTNMDSVMIEMNGTIDLLEGAWPDGVGAPMLMKLNPDAMPVMVTAVDVNGLNMEQISRYTEDTVQPAIERLEGVASVTGLGLLESQVMVRIDPGKVQELNGKIQESVNSKLEEARKELEEAQDELDSGKSALSEQGRSRTQQVTQAQLDLVDGKIQIAEAQMEISSGRAQLQQVAAMAEQTISQLKAQLDPLLDQRSELQAKIDEVEGGIGQINAQIDQLEAAITALEALEELTPEQETELETMRDLLTQAEEGRQEAEEGLRQAQTGMAELQDGIDALQANIDTAEASLASTNAQIASLDAASSSLQGTAAQISGGGSQIAAGAGALTSGLNEAVGELAAAQAVITVGSNQMDAQEDTARESADITDMITPAMVAQIIGAQNFGMPAGYVHNNGEEYLVRVGDELGSLESLEELVLLNLGMDDIDPVRVKDIGGVTMTDNADDLYAKINGNDGVILMMQKQSTYSTADVSDAIGETIRDLEDKNPNLHITTLMDQGMYIDMVVENVLQNLLYGAVLAIIVLFLFLRSLRPTVIIAVSIPISVVFALVLMYFSGVTLNLISLAGLALGVGMLVDNSIVVIENVFRMRALGTPPKEAAIKGASQVAGAITASTITTICVFLPIVFTNGISRELFSDMALTITYSLLASLLVALTLVPAMAAPLLQKDQKDETRFFRWFQEKYGKALRWTLGHKWAVLLPVLGLFVFCIWQALQAGVSFMPEMDSAEMTLTVEMPPGSTFGETKAMADTVISRLEAMPQVETVGAVAGNTMTTFLGGSSDSSVSMYVTLREDRDITSAQAAEQIREKTGDLDCEVTVSASTMDMSSYMGSGIEVRIEGESLEDMRRTAQEVAELLQQQEGTMDVSDGLEDSTPEIRIIVDKNKAIGEGLTVAGVYQVISSEISDGISAGSLQLDMTDYPVMVADKDAAAMTPDELRGMEISGEVAGEKKTVHLGDIADIEESMSLDAINRENQVRTITVSAAVDSSHNVGLVSRAFEQKLRTYHPPGGIAVRVEGENATIMDALEDMFFMLVVAIGLIYLIMVAQFQSLKSPFIVMFTIPLAFTGGLLALFLTGMDLSVISMLGFLMLSGIIVNNGIVFVDYVNQLRESGQLMEDALIEAGRTRMRPILMTALTTILGLTTLALGVGTGADMLQPMAVVTIGGLIYATALTLFVVPSLYALFHRRARREKDDSSAEMQGSEN